MKKKDIPIPEVIPQTLAGVEEQERHYALITPLFGGGAIQGERDEVTVVRGTEIRGHLRFWWRACYGGRYSSIKDMKEAEDLLWGAAATSKKNEEKKEGVKGGKEDEEKPKDPTVQIMVELMNEDGTLMNVKDVKGVPAYKKEDGKDIPDPDIPAYAAFPLQPTSTGKPAKLIYKDVCFCLTISFPSSKRLEIQGTLWAWETFGGVGARTRRGFGAIKLKGITNVGYVQGKKIRQPVTNELLPNITPIGVKDWLNKKFSQFGIEKKAPEGVPSLSKQMLNQQVYILTPPSKNASEAWKAIVGKLLTFRRNKEWPDTQEVKRIKKVAEGLTTHKYTFLKAPLGLPIVFHFPKEGKEADLTLQGSEEGHERLSSPLILRPLLCQGEQYLGLIVLLENYVPYLENVQVMKKVEEGLQKIPAIIETKLDGAGNRSIPLFGGEKDVLMAFMMSLQPPQRRNNQNNN